MLFRAIEELSTDPEPEGSEVIEEGGERFHLWQIGQFLIAYEIHDRRLVIVVLSVREEEGL